MNGTFDEKFSRKLGSKLGSAIELSSRRQNLLNLGTTFFAHYLTVFYLFAVGVVEPVVAAVGECGGGGEVEGVAAGAGHAGAGITVISDLRTFLA